MAAYYNEIDPYCVEWLWNLMAEGLIPLGYVDSRPIQEVSPDELEGYDQLHFFAGVAGWPLSLRLAGWPDDRPIWTGSCPCQPFSVAGKRQGAADPRHLWPHFYRLIRACRPPVVMGEQVDKKAGYAWLDGVRSDLEAEGYTCRAVDIPACAVGAPHRRNRIYWVAHTDRNAGLACQSRTDQRERSAGSDEGLADVLGPRLEGRAGEQGDDGTECEAAERGGGGIDGMVYADDSKRRSDESRGDNDHGTEARWYEGDGDTEGSSRAPGAWDDWRIIGPDGKGKFRRIESTIEPVAPRIPETMAILRALGNAIVPPLAAEVIKSWMEVSDA